MAQLGYTVVGVELVEKPLRHAAHVATQMGLAHRVVLLHHDLFKLPDTFTVHVARRMTQPQASPPEPHDEPNAFSVFAQLVNTIRPHPDTLKFDFIFDCQCFHVLRRVNQDALLHKYATYLKPKTGLLMVLAGRTKVQTSLIPAGIPVLTQDEMRACFDDTTFEIIFLTETVFDDTDEYLKRGLKMPAWWMLARKK
ncbi:hypothetical protein SeLEV6574_g00094 [Synchytrium endobioticum]|nr:hypothetical protein SeLEV6574_g00094 [Synchytrium endobioticum]